jgi:hypothetical protein
MGSSGKTTDEKPLSGCRKCGLLFWHGFGTESRGYKEIEILRSGAIKA